MNEDRIKLKAIDYKIYTSFDDYGKYIGVDIWDKNNDLGTGLKVSTEELEMFDISEGGFRELTTDHMYLIDRLLHRRDNIE